MKTQNRIENPGQTGFVMQEDGRDKSGCLILPRGRDRGKTRAQAVADVIDMSDPEKWRGRR